MYLLLPFLAMMTTMPPPPLPPSQQQMGQLVVIGLNSALQKRFILPQGDSLIPGKVHRAARMQHSVGGKGQDVAIALHCLLSSNNNKIQHKVPQQQQQQQQQQQLQLIQFIGRGSEGDAVYHMLVDRLGESAMTLTIRSESGMRTCTSIVDADATTELVEPSGHITNEELQELLDKTASQIKNQASGVCIMGSMPPGCPPETYGKFYSQLVGPSTVCVVDSVTGILELIETAKTMGKDAVVGPILFKMNASELLTLVGTLNKRTSDMGGVDPTDLMDAITKFDLKYSPQGVLVGLAITDGKHPAYFASLGDDKTKFQLFRIPIPTLDDASAILYPIGAGDAVAAGTLAAWVCLQGEAGASTYTIPDQCYQLLLDRVGAMQNEKISGDVAKAVSALSFGLICGTASCLQEDNSVLATSDVVRLFQRIGTPTLLPIESVTNIQKTS
jgi:fructose-1-phosphate kinase PfkB-like protein